MSYEKYEEWKRTPIGERPHLSVVIPAYNEEERIVPTIGAFASHICGLGFPWELIVADDGSKDRTVAIVEDLGLANVRVLRAERNGGKGSAVRRGVLAARGDLILFADADNSTPVEELGRLVAAIEGGAAVAVGSRAADGAKESNKSALRRLASGGLRWMVRAIFQIGVRDTQCGFKLFTREAAQRLYSAQTINGFSFDLEILYLAAKLRYRVAEVPVAWIDAPGSKVNVMKEVRRFAGDLIRIKMNDLRGVYARA